MDWNILLSLVCPLIMLFCMKGMFSGHNHGDVKDKTGQSQDSPQDLQSLQTKVAELTEQNAYLLKEIQSMKESLSPANGMNANSSLNN